MSGLIAAGAGVTGLVAKATLVLCLALTLAWLARRGSARTLHLLWTTAFVLLLALPALSLLGPSWTLPILPARDIGVEGASLEAGDGAAAAQAPREMAGPAVSSGPSRRIAGAGTSSGFPTVESSRPRPGPGDEPAPLTPSDVAFLIWALGFGAALTSLAVGSLRFRKLVREGVPVRDPAWRQQIDAIRRRLRVRSQVRILMSPKVPTPMAGGPLRPVILLPSVAAGWSPERRAVVLAHELVHVRRCDALRQVVGRAVVALYWFHPLSWPAWRAATIAAERSCDEEVLELGTRPSEYARHLFSLASGTTGGRAVPALPMVQRSQLENRIMAILKRHRPRYSLARTIAALAGIGVAGTLIACANPVPRDPDAQPAPRDQAIVPGEVQAQDRVISAPSPEFPAPANPEDAGTRPLAGAPAMPDPAPVSTPVSGLRPEPGSLPEVALDAGRQAFECNPGNRIGLMRRRGEWTLQRRVDAMRLCMRNHGNFEMASDATSIQSMDDDGWLVLESQAERLHRLVITPGPGGLEYDWSIDGRPEVFDDEAEEWRDLMLTVMDGYLDVQAVRGEEATLRGEIAVHRGHISTLRGRISTHRGHVSTLRGQIATHRGHVATLRGEVAAHRGHVAGLRGQMSSPSAQVAGVMSRLSAQMELIVNQHALTTLADRMREAVETARQEWTTARSRAVSESFRESVERVEVQEAIEAARQAAGTADVAEAMQAAAQAMADIRETMADMAELSETLSAAADDWTTVANDLQQIERDLAARRGEFEREAAALARERMREIEAQIEEYDLDGKVAEIEAQIAQYDLDGRIAEIEAQIEEYDLDGRIREIEAQIEELDADRRADEIERSIQDEIAALRTLIG